MNTVSAIAVIDLANELIGRGAIDASCLSTLGSDFDAYYLAWQNHQAIQEKRLPEDLLIELWSLAETRNGDSDIGVRIGSKINHSAKGLLANWVFQCSTLGESFDTFSKNIHLLNPSEKWLKSQDGEYFKLVFEFDGNTYPDIAIDRSMTTIISWSVALTGYRPVPLKATFARPRPENLREYERIFGPNLSFDEGENSLLFSKSVLLQKNETSNPYLKELLENKAFELSSVLASQQSISGAVESLLSHDLSRYYQIDAVCHELHASRSTLYRKLKAENSSFTELLRKTRIAKARSLEEQNETPGNIADDLGFQDVGSYYRFRKTFN